MLRLFIVSLILISAVSVYGKGCSGEYFIKGIAYDANNEKIIEGEILVSFNDSNWVVRTDKSGRYELIIQWTSPCRSSVPQEEIERLELKYNPKTIELKYQDHSLSIKNEWKKYAKCWPKNDNSVTWKRNIRFK